MAKTDSPFDVGDALIYPQHGAGRVIDRKTKDFFGEKRDYLLVDVELQELKVWVPVDEIEDLGVRPPTPKDELDELFEMLSDHDIRVPANFSRRFKNNQRRLNDGDVWQLAEVVRNLAVRQSKAHLSPSEKSMYAHARNLLISELALSLKSDREKAEAKLDSLLPEPKVND